MHEVNNSMQVRAARATRCAVLFSCAGILVIGLVVISFLLDSQIEHWITAHQNPTTETAAKFVSRYGAWHWLMLVSVACLAIAWFRGRQDWIRVLIAMMIAASIAGLSADILRGLTGRTRPNALIAQQGWYGIHHDGHWLIGRHAYNSFPSGHSSSAFAFAVPLLCSRRWLPGALLLLGAITIAASRLYLGDHHFSDVTCGAMLGTGVAMMVWFHLLEKLAHRRQRRRDC